MGQYYNVVTMGQDGEINAYNRMVDGEYTMAKLMEHSWWYNEFVSTMTKMLYHNPMRIAWIGDYSNDDDYLRAEKDPQFFNMELFKKFFDAAWGESSDESLLGVKKDILLLDGKFLVNHTYKTYVDCDEYRYLSDPDDTKWIIHPLPLLTCVGNGLGCGDYYGDNEQEAGSWCMAEVSVEDEIPEGYEKMSELYFVED